MEKSKTLIDVPCLSGPVPYPLMEVVWDDASVTGGWEPADIKLEQELVLTVGFLTKTGKDHIVLSASICEGVNDTTQRIQIPIGMIKHIKEIK